MPYIIYITANDISTNLLLVLLCLQIVKEKFDGGGFGCLEFLVYGMDERVVVDVEGAPISSKA